MNLFDQLVNEALKNNAELSSLRMVVEKELLHHDILRTLSESGLLEQLTFIGGTCLRTCYGAKRLSEDLDFTGGADFSRKNLSHMSQILVDTIKTKYDFKVNVTEPTREMGNVDTWKLQVIMNHRNKDLPMQRIHIDICAIPSYQRIPTLLINPYGVEMGTNGLIIQAQSLEEIFSDKLVALALRKSIKYRDLWDIFWLQSQNIKPDLDLIPLKIKDHHRDPQEFLQLLEQRSQLLKTKPEIMQEFRKEMARFISGSTNKATLENDVFWITLVNLVNLYCEKIKAIIY